MSRLSNVYVKRWRLPCFVTGLVVSSPLAGSLQHRHKNAVEVRGQSSQGRFCGRGSNAMGGRDTLWLSVG